MGPTVSEGVGVYPTSEELELDAVLRDIIGAAQRSYPTFRLPPDDFVAYLRERLPADIPQPLALREMHTSDLYLACACANGDVHAFAAFEERCVSHLDRALGRMGLATDVIADVKQDIRSRVLIGEGGRAEIVDFCGRGDLRGWVRVMAARHAIRRQCRARREVSVEDDELLQRMAASDNPELDYAKGLYRQEFRRAFEGAFRALPDREQMLLSLHYIDGSTLDELAGLYRVHRATVARWLARARDLVFEDTKERLMSQLDVLPQDLDSILRMVRSQIEISLQDLRARKR